MLTVILATTLIQEAQLGTMKIDVVTIIETGQPVHGFEAISTVRDGYRYLFSDETNKQKFKASRRYDIQLGGGCGKMGSLSGKGSTDRFGTYNGRVYLFASDGCRSSFMANPDARIERDDPIPSRSRREETNGRRLFNQVVNWMGGRQALVKIYEYQEVLVGTYKEGDKTFPMELRKVYTYPDRLAHYDKYDKDLISTVAKGKTGYFEMPSGRKEPFFGAQVREMERIRDHKLVPAMLKAMGKGAVFADRGDGVLDVFQGGTGVRLWTSQPTGEVKAIESRSRGPRGDYGALKLSFTKFRAVKGVKVPVSWEASFNGEPAPSLSTEDLGVSIEHVGIPRG
ncbi:MAG: hypothetical protein JNM34_02195 [Chthonomonadaceae bacterium]|nr:hypothetical protein [Chthonomonadaceae bacterium]